MSNWCQSDNEIRADDKRNWWHILESLRDIWNIWPCVIHYRELWLLYCVATHVRAFYMLMKSVSHICIIYVKHQSIPIIKKNTNCDDATLFTDTVYDDLLKPENVTYIREVSAEANASVDESKRPASTEPAESFRKLNVDWCVLIECL